jgi:hypothetical protein
VFCARKLATPNSVKTSRGNIAPNCFPHTYCVLEWCLLYSYNHIPPSFFTNGREKRKRIIKIKLSVLQLILNTVYRSKNTFSTTTQIIFQTSVLLSHCQAIKHKLFIKERQSACGSVANHRTFQSFVCLHGNLH